MLPDILWYKHSDVLCEKSEPTLLKSDWAKVLKIFKETLQLILREIHNEIIPMDPYFCCIDESINYTLKFYFKVENYHFIIKNYSFLRSSQ